MEGLTLQPGAADEVSGLFARVEQLEARVRVLTAPDERTRGVSRDWWLAKTTESISNGTAGEVQRYAGTTQGSEATTVGDPFDAWNRTGSTISSGSWVDIFRINGSVGWEMKPFAGGSTTASCFVNTSGSAGGTWTANTTLYFAPSWEAAFSPNGTISVDGTDGNKLVSSIGQTGILLVTYTGTLTFPSPSSTSTLVNGIGVSFGSSNAASVVGQIDLSGGSAAMLDWLRPYTSSAIPFGGTACVLVNFSVNEYVKPQLAFNSNSGNPTGTFLGANVAFFPQSI